MPENAVRKVAKAQRNISPTRLLSAVAEARRKRDETGQLYFVVIRSPEEGADEAPRRISVHVLPDDPENFAARPAILLYDEDKEDYRIIPDFAIDAMAKTPEELAKDVLA